MEPSKKKPMLGPLSSYRQLASFDWKLLKVFLYGQEFIDLVKLMSDEFSKYPEFIEHDFETPTLTETRKKTFRKVFSRHLMSTLQNAASDNKSKANSRLMYSMEPSMAIITNSIFGLFPNSIQYLGTERHEHILNKALKCEIIGSFELSEIGHGSNTKGMRTTATYDIQTEEFVLNSPDFEAAKCWAGQLGLTATYVVAWAHLTTPDGVKRGLHAFLVPIRDLCTLVPYSGLTIMDMGEKSGLNGMDNGLIMFNHYRVPREALLNRLSNVAKDGTYHTPYQNLNKLHGASFGNLSEGRINISFCNVVFLTKALTIAIRYSAVRKQFGIGNGDEEIPILEYQTHQYRLLPYLAANYCLDILCNYLFAHKMPKTDDSGNMSLAAEELHAISSACKPLSTWLTRDAIRECREACGGHGYLKVLAAGLGSLRNDQDASCTYEGANHVLLQQTSRWLLKHWPSILKREKIITPFKTLDFLNDVYTVANAKFSAKSVEDITEHTAILKAYQWLIYFLIKRYNEKFEHNLAISKNPILARNNSQVYVANDLAIVYIEHFALLTMSEKIMQARDFNIKMVLTRLMSLYGLWSLQKHISTLYIGGYATGPETGSLIQEAILKLCSELKNDAVALIDTIAPPDFILNSVLGYSDGEVYKHLEAAMLQAPGALSRPKWWKEIVYWKDYVKPRL